MTTSEHTVPSVDSQEALTERLEALYRQTNDPVHISPDPLEVLYRFQGRENRELAGLIAALLAYGGVKQIVASAGEAVGRMGPAPSDFLARASGRELADAFRGFRHRWTTGADMAALLRGVRAVALEYGSLEACFRAHMKEGDESILPGLEGWVRAIRSGSRPVHRDLLACPSRGSACKRLNLFLRWMVRKDRVDPGLWQTIPASLLVIPLDLHMFRIGRALGFTARKQADLRAAQEITRAFRRLRPDDPVRYDFALTRASMRGVLDLSGMSFRSG